MNSVKRTSRAVVIDQGYLSYGVTAEIASLIADEAFEQLLFRILQYKTHFLPEGRKIGMLIGKIFAQYDDPPRLRCIEAVHVLQERGFA